MLTVMTKFSGDIFSNITISAPQLGLKEAWEAAEMAGVADDIRNMPMGMQEVSFLNWLKGKKTKVFIPVQSCRKNSIVRRYPSKRMQQAKVCPYLLRNAVIDRPNQAWSIDITYIAIKHGFLYLTAVIDWYSRCIVGWEVDDTLDTRMVITALKKAFMVAKPVILNSDQGCQFTSNEYMNFLKENQIRQSMDGKSRWADNIMIERWFRSFKYEEAYLTQYNNIREARKAIGKYVHTYNFERCHSALNNQTPASCYYPILLLDDCAA